MRVAVRRTRSTLKLGRSVLPAAMQSRWEPAFKWLGDLTTPVRDLDVYELDLPTMAGWLVGADASDLAPFAAHLRRRRTVERRALVRGLRSVRFQRLDAGDLLLTGTPAGTALSAPPKPVEFIAAFLPPALKWKLFFKRQAQNPKYLKHDDVVELAIGTDDGAIDLGRQRTVVRGTTS